MHSVWIGFDPRESAAFAVARESARVNSSIRLPVHGVVLSELKRQGLYSRPTEKRLGKLYDVISAAPMSTEFAISRFLVPHIAETGWALFMDCDVLVRGNLARMFDSLDRKYALYCVKHDYVPVSGVKMDGQEQTSYPRKNWSSVMVFNCDHPANKKLTVNQINMRPGRELHRFCWLTDDLIGELEPEWNWLVGEEKQPDDPKLVHWTNGGPWFNAFYDAPFADEWRYYHEARWAA